MTTKNGTSVEVYDVILASQIEDNDLIVYSNDALEVKSHFDETDVIFVRGYSHISGDTVTYFIPADTEVELWKF